MKPIYFLWLKYHLFWYACKRWISWYGFKGKRVQKEDFKEEIIFLAKEIIKTLDDQMKKGKGLEF